MPNFAIINNNTVSNVIVADSKEIAVETTNAEDAVETTGQPWIGWTRIDGQWINPEPEIIDVEEVTPTPALEG